jgi:hypothetical protein
MTIGRKALQIDHRRRDAWEIEQDGTVIYFLNQASKRLQIIRRKDCMIYYEIPNQIADNSDLEQFFTSVCC